MGREAPRPPSCRVSMSWSCQTRGSSRSPAASGRRIAGWAGTPLTTPRALPACLAGHAQLHRSNCTDGSRTRIEDHSHLGVYGSDLADLQNLIDANPEWSRPIHPALPYLAGEAIWAIRHEAARSVEDILTRRTRALFLDARASLDAAPRIAALAAQELKRDQAWQVDQVERFHRLAEDYGAERR